MSETKNELVIPEITDEQVENLRRVLVVILGPYALLMKREQIIAYRDNLQSKINNIEREKVNHE